MKARSIRTSWLLFALFLIPFLATAQEKPALDTLSQQTQEMIKADSSETLETAVPNTLVEQGKKASLPPAKSSNQLWIPLLLALLALAGLVYLFFTKVDKTQLGPQADFFRKDFEEGTQRLLQQIDNLEAQQADLESRLKVLEDLNAAQTSEEAVPETIATEEAIAIPVPIEAKPGPIQTMYAVAPKNGIFFMRQLSPSFKAREHIYRIEVLDEARAYYYLVDDSATRQHAFNIPDSYILPAMELEGTGRLAEASQVEVQRGSLVKAGQNWQIEEKAVLNYSI